MKLPKPSKSTKNQVFALYPITTMILGSFAEPVLRQAGSGFTYAIPPFTDAPPAMAYLRWPTALLLRSFEHNFKQNGNNRQKFRKI